MYCSLCIARSSQRCKIPSHHKDSEIVCKTFPSRMECIQTCVYGYTVDTGVSKTYECSDGEWSPDEPFEKCKPYEDMTVALEPGGISLVAPPRNAVGGSDDSNFIENDYD
ncbi:hypothetical protein CEXT_293891 [Caerostris extrusa]|uniref:Sushi domain-containing protein n=1 Tax=Caerostris extrusa TaxID=172846 RepID=A0AAV4WBY8_CAEEX|nr:hypothetical protein CEXT_293891 [Caerostris extrusa]